MDEFERIARLRECFASPPGAGGVLLGIGDDAAVLSASAQNLVLSVDAAVDGVHFRTDLADWETIGARAFTAALSDLAGMGAEPRAALTAIVMPPELPDADFLALARGLAATARRYRCPIAGGNLARGSEISITTTVIGEVEGSGLTRAGARAGDGIFVTGTLGAAALGLALLQRASPELGRAFVARWQAPEARIAEGRALLSCASAAIDVSDGLLQDLGHLCAASGVGAEIESARLPWMSGFSELARELGLDPVSLSLAGGEDYELVYTLPEPSDGDSQALAAARRLGTQIGRITGESGVLQVRDPAGRPLPATAHGYRHFTG